MKKSMLFFVGMFLLIFATQNLSAQAPEAKLKMDEKEEKSTFIEEMLLPFGNIYSNFLTQQDYSNDYLIAQLANSLKVPVHVIPFIYLPQVENKEASMTFHLTKNEKSDIVNAYDNEFNQYMEAKLKKLLKVK